MTLTILPVTGIPDIRPGDDLAKMIASTAPWLEDGDVLVVTSKIVSKAEGNLARLPAEAGPARDAAKAAILAGQTARIVATRGNTRIVATAHGFVMASAGIDESNVDNEHVVLLPVDPDASARRLRADLRSRYGLDVVVLISDTMGRPWRVGLTDVALGAAGMDPLRDYRGEHDAYGHELSITQMSIADELCGAAELVKGKYDQVPVAVVRGLGIVGQPDGPGATAIVRGPEQDMFSLGTAEARADGLRLAARLDDTGAWPDTGAPGPGISEARPAGAATGAGLDAAVERAIEAAGPDVTWRRDGDLLVPMVEPEAAPVAVARAGYAVHVLRCALAAEGYRTSWLAHDGAPIGAVAVRGRAQT